MGTLEDLTIIKLGGSLITNKDKMLTPNTENLKAVAREIASSGIARSSSVFLIHGGGSYGHNYADKYGVSKVTKKYPAVAISKIAESMMDLHTIVLGHLYKQGLNCKTVLTSEFLTDDCSMVTRTGLRNLDNIYRCELVPLSFGNVFIDRMGSKIVSGDQIALALARTVKTKQVVFAMDVDGIHVTPSLKSPVIDVLDQSTKIDSVSRKYDVTGGIAEKISVGLKLAELGAKVFYVSGWKKNRLERVLVGRSNVLATQIYPKGLQSRQMKRVSRQDESRVDAHWN